MNTIGLDLRYALRMLAKNPGFAAVAILTMALGLGANTAIFSVVNAALIRPLPFQEPERLVALGEARLQQKASGAANVSLPDYLDWTKTTKSFDNLTAFTGNTATMTGGGSVESLNIGMVTSNFFDTLGVKPYLGRDFLPGEDRTNGEKVAILSEKFRKEHFGQNPSVIGQSIRLNGEGWAIVGVLPRGFEFAGFGTPDIWVPLRAPARIAERRNLRWLNAIGRIRRSVSQSQALAEMNGVNAQLAAAYPQENGSIRIVMTPLREVVVGPIRVLLLTLLGAVGFVLLIACVNVANLLLVRSTARRKEIAIRMAIGAGRMQVIRQLLTESILLALIGGVLGVVLAEWGVTVLVAAIPKGLLASMPYLTSLHVDATMLAFAFGLAVLTGVLFGLAPALQMFHAEAGKVLKEESRSATGIGGAWLRDGLVVAELSVSIVLLMGAGLMVRSMSSLLRQDPGFQSQNLLTFQVNGSKSTRKDDAAALNFEERLKTVIERLPGVQGMTTVSKLPVTGAGNTIRFLVEGRPKAKGSEDEAFIRDVSANYLGVMKIPLVIGRFFGPDDTAKAPRRLVVNKSFVDTYFADEDPIGKRIRFTFSDKNPYVEIVGVIANENSNALDAPMAPIIYSSFEQGPNSSFFVVVRTARRPEEMVAAIQGELRNIDPELPMVNPLSMEQVISQSYSVFLRRYPSYLIGSFAILAMVLAMVGLYGQISFGVIQRTREIGIRMALGAQRRDVLRLIVGRGIFLTLLGVGIGIVAALGFSRLLGSLLFGVKPYDPWTLGAVTILLSLAAVAAAYIPGRRAARVDPIDALRYE